MHPDLVFAIEQAVTPDQLEAVHSLFLEYQEYLGVDLCFQNFSSELAGLPGAYRPPAGRLLLASTLLGVAGCIALRPLRENACEMKRLYVKPRFRGLGLGRLLVSRIIQEGRQTGYHEMFLDTLPSMTKALGLYRAQGFIATEPYYYNPLPDTRYLVLDMRSWNDPYSLCIPGSRLG